jgi:hypothetical protein
VGHARKCLCPKQSSPGTVKGGRSGGFKTPIAIEFLEIVMSHERTVPDRLRIDQAFKSLRFDRTYSAAKPLAGPGMALSRRSVAANSPAQLSGGACARHVRKTASSRRETRDDHPTSGADIPCLMWGRACRIVQASRIRPPWRVIGARCEPFERDSCLIDQATEECAELTVMLCPILRQKIVSHDRWPQCPAGKILGGGHVNVPIRPPPPTKRSTKLIS